jgi:hypothetical protein
MGDTPVLSGCRMYSLSATPNVGLSSRNTRVQDCSGTLTASGRVLGMRLLLAARILQEIRDENSMGDTSPSPKVQLVLPKGDAGHQLSGGLAVDSFSLLLIWLYHN